MELVTDKSRENLHQAHVLAVLQYRHQVLCSKSFPFFIQGKNLCIILQKEFSSTQTVLQAKRTPAV